MDNLTDITNSDLITAIKSMKEITGQIPMVEVVRKSLKKFVSKKAPREAKPKELTPTRYIPKHTSFKVKERDRHQCTFIAPDGHRCSETHALQIDHIVPYALGGTNCESNLRLLCPAHNRLCAERVFGKEKIESYLHRWKWNSSNETVLNSG